MILHIAVGVLRRGRQVLISQRRVGTPGAGEWEFPGGKREPQEEIRSALHRELSEELGIAVRQCQPFIRLRHQYSDRAVLLDTWLVDHWAGEPQGLEGQAIRWVDIDALPSAGLLAADRPIVTALEMPAQYAFTPADLSAAAVRERWPSLKEDGLVRLRLPSLNDADYYALVLDLYGLGGPHLVVDRPHLDWSAALPAGALSWHAPVQQFRSIVNAHPTWPRWRIASAHTADDCAAAVAWGADALVIGNLRATPSHPGQPGLGWQGYKALADTSGRPCYAIGGMAPSDLPAARWGGATGVAGIRGFWD